MSAIVVGYDGSACGEAALDEALGAGPALGDTVTVVFGYAPPGIWGGEIADHEEAIEELGEKVLGEAREQAAAAAAPRSTSELVPKRARRGADRGGRRARRADDRRRQLRRGGAARACILGSTPNKLLHLTDRPVLVVPAEEDERMTGPDATSTVEPAAAGRGVAAASSCAT